MRLKQRILSALLIGTLFAPALTQPARAANGLIYISPGSASVQVGQPVSMSLRIYPGTPVDTVQATVTYNPAYLQFNGASAAGSFAPFRNSGAGGTVTLVGNILGGSVSSDSAVFNLSFTALASIGSSFVSVSGVDAALAGASINPSAAGATVSFTAPPVTAPVGGSGGGSSHNRYSKGGTAASSASPAAADTAAAPSEPAKPVHLKGKLNSAAYTSAEFNVQSDQPVSLYVAYGTDEKNLASKTDAVSGTKAKLILANGSLTPGTDYYYQVVGVDGAGNVTKLPVQHFATSGFTVRVSVLDQHNQPLKNAKVTLHSRPQTLTTDGSGEATFTGVAPGVHHLEYMGDNHVKYSSVVYVENKLLSAGSGKTQNAPVQTAAVQLPVQPASNGSAKTMVVASVGVALLTFLLGVEMLHGRLKLRGGQRAIRLVVAGRTLL